MSKNVIYFFRYLKVHNFGSIFSLKLSLRLKTMLNSIKTLKINYKDTLSMFKKKSFLMITKYFIYKLN